MSANTQIDMRGPRDFGGGDGGGWQRSGSLHTRMLSATHYPDRRVTRWDHVDRGADGPSYPVEQMRPSEWAWDAVLWVAIATGLIGVAFAFGWAMGHAATWLAH